DSPAACGRFTNAAKAAFASKPARRQAERVFWFYERDEMTKEADTAALLERLLSERILIMDGAMGTMIQSYKLGERDFRGACFIDHGNELAGDNDILVLSRPDVVRAIHHAY